MPNPLTYETAQKAATQNGWYPFIGAAVVVAGWLVSVYIRDRSDAGIRRSKFRSYMDIAIRAIDAEPACNLAIPSSFQKCIDLSEFDAKRKEVRPDIFRKGIFDAACEACKTSGFISYDDANNPARKQELIKRLARVRSLAW
jgi:hypothetical protein